MSDVEMAEIEADEDLNISDGKGILSGSEEGEINESDSDSASSRHRHKVVCIINYLTMFLRI